MNAVDQIPETEEPVASKATGINSEFIQDELTDEIEAELPPEIGEEEENPLDSLELVLSKHTYAPGRLQLEEWQDVYGTFYASSVSGEDVYVWRTLKRMDHKSIAASGAMEEQDKFETAVLRRCLLWPQGSSDFFHRTDAGVVPTVFKQVMHQSGFISEEEAVSLIRRI